MRVSSEPLSGGTTSTERVGSSLQRLDLLLAERRPFLLLRIVVAVRPVATVIVRTDTLVLPVAVKGNLPALGGFFEESPLVNATPMSR